MKITNYYAGSMSPRGEHEMMNEQGVGLTIVILTGAITSDSLDPHAVLCEADLARERERYIDMLVEATRARWPGAEIDTTPGNGLRTVEVYGPADSPAEDAAIEGEWRDISLHVYEVWSEGL